MSGKATADPQLRPFADYPLHLAVTSYCRTHMTLQAYTAEYSLARIGSGYVYCRRLIESPASVHVGRIGPWRRQNQAHHVQILQPEPFETDFGPTFGDASEEVV